MFSPLPGLSPGGAEEVLRLPSPDGKVMHAELRIGDSVVMIGEECLDRGAKGPQALGGFPVTMHVYVADADALMERAVRAGAKETMPMAAQFWGDRYGRVQDPYGHSWSIATHTTDVTPEECIEAAKRAP